MHAPILPAKTGECAIVQCPTVSSVLHSAHQCHTLPHISAASTVKPHQRRLISAAPSSPSEAYQILNMADESNRELSVSDSDCEPVLSSGTLRVRGGGWCAHQNESFLARSRLPQNQHWHPQLAYWNLTEYLCKKGHALMGCYLSPTGLGPMPVYQMSFKFLYGLLLTQEQLPSPLLLDSQVAR